MGKRGNKDIKSARETAASNEGLETNEKSDLCCRLKKEWTHILKHNSLRY